MDPSQRRLVAGRYRLLEPLGAGGMGTVWRAQDEVLGREVAVKEVTFPRGLSDEDREVLRERTRREARAAARLDHPSAVTVYDVVEEDGSPYLVMELVEARTLSQVVRTDGPLTPQRTAQVGLALLGALEKAHRQGIVHRDVKPGNVLLCPETVGGRVVLTDFGIASSVGDSSITSTGLLLGSPSYIAPERARGESPRPASDLWSLGATLFTAVEGRPPYDGGDPLTTVTAVVTGEHAPFLAAGPLEPLLEGLLERDPERRLTPDAARRLLEPVAAVVAPVRLPAPSPEAERRTEETTALPLSDLHAAAEGIPAGTAAETAAGGTAHPWPAAPPVSRPPLVLDQPPRGRRGWRLPALLLALALVAAAGVAGAVLAGRDGGTGTDAGPSAGPSASTATDPVALPAGWTTYTDDSGGWSVGVPPGFVQSVRRGQVQFRDDERRRTLRISTATVDQDPVAASRALSASLRSSLADYDELGVEPVEGGADLGFTYVDETRPAGAQPDARRRRGPQRLAVLADPRHRLRRRPGPVRPDRGDVPAADLTGRLCTTSQPACRSRRAAPGTRR